MTELLRTRGKNGLEINVYKEEFSLIATHEGKDGNHYQQWGKAKIGKDSYSGPAFQDHPGRQAGRGAGAFGGSPSDHGE